MSTTSYQPIPTEEAEGGVGAGAGAQELSIVSKEEREMLDKKKNSLLGTKKSSQRTRNLNRSRKNTPLHRDEIMNALYIVNNLRGGAPFDLARYQHELLFGTPDEARKARKELQAIARILDDIHSGKINKYQSVLPPHYVTGKHGILGAAFMTGATSGYSGLIITVAVLASGPAAPITAGILAGLGGLMLLTSAAAGYILGSRKHVILQRYTAKSNLQDLFYVILKVLDESKTQPSAEQVFELKKYIIEKKKKGIENIGPMNRELLANAGLEEPGVGFPGALKKKEFAPTLTRNSPRRNRKTRRRQRR